MKTLIKTLLLGALVISASQQAAAKTLLGEVKVNQSGQIIGTVLNQGTKTISTTAAGFPASVAPGETKTFKINQPKAGETVEVRYVSPTGNGCIYYIETLNYSITRDITQIFAQPLHTKEWCSATGFYGNHIGIATDFDRTNK